MKNFFTICLTGLFLSLFSPKASAESVVYIIMGYDLALAEPSIKMSINEQHVCDMELQLKKAVQDVRIYKKAVKKFIFNTEDKFIFSYDAIGYGSIPRHADITLDIIDGMTYYVQICQNSFKNGWAFKMLKEKDALKKLKKTKDYDLLPDYVYPAK